MQNGIKVNSDLTKKDHISPINLFDSVLDLTSNLAFTNSGCRLPTNNFRERCWPKAKLRALLILFMYSYSNSVIFLFDNVLMMTMTECTVLHVSAEMLTFFSPLFIFTVIAFRPRDHKNINKMLIVTFLLWTKMKCLPQGERVYQSNTTRLQKGQNKPRMDIKLNMHMT